MRVADPGHLYVLEGGNTDATERFVLRFAKSDAPPGYSGTTLSEVLLACIDRMKYLDNAAASEDLKPARESLFSVIAILETKKVQTDDQG